LVIDLLQVALGSGCTPRQAVEVGTRWGPTQTAAALGGALDGTRLGLALGDALGLAAQQHPALAPLVDVLIVSERLGAPAGVALARLSEETRADLRRAAEAGARTLPVKLLFPLVFLVLPAFGLLTVVPALLRALERL
jgi:tight adherence protein C